jgi:class 3 adenylate cyclase
VAVRKTVTVLFCDLVGSTALGDEADPEVVQERMTSYHAELRRILERHGGTVEKFVGDAAMAVFGIPDVHEDEALRAVRAATEIHAKVGELGLEVRTGLNTGEVIAGEGETLVTGDAVNVAARLEQAAEPGHILIGEATEALVRDAVRVEPVEPLELKGKSQPVPAFQVVELLPDVPAFTRAIEAPFVGREQELQTLEDALERATTERQPQLVTVVGPPGIGKSRLIRELVRRADARVLVGRCLSYGEGITYWPVQEITDQVGDIEAVLDEELARARISAALGDGSASPEEIAWGVRRLFEALAQERPLVVVLDDIHWAEPTLLDLIEYVGAFASDAPLLLLCSARPDLFERRPAWATPKPNAGMVTLEPLPEEQAQTLVDELGELSTEAKGRIVEAAEGNPLFVEQLVAMQAESGNGHLEVPPSLQALLAARIDLLEDDERAVIERASVEGRLFHRGSVQELVPDEVRPDVGGHLLTLVRKEFVRPDRSQLPGDDGFRFGHILIRDAAYDSIPKRLRAELHERFAGWLERRMGEETPDEIVGYHLEQAYRYGAELGAHDAELGNRAADTLAAAAWRRERERTPGRRSSSSIAHANSSRTMHHAASFSRPSARRCTTQPTSHGLRRSTSRRGHRQRQSAMCTSNGSRGSVSRTFASQPIRKERPKAPSRKHGPRSLQGSRMKITRFSPVPGAQSAWPTTCGARGTTSFKRSWRLAGTHARPVTATPSSRSSCIRLVHSSSAQSLWRMDSGSWTKCSKRQATSPVYSSLPSTSSDTCTLGWATSRWPMPRSTTSAPSSESLDRR